MFDVEHTCYGQYCNTAPVPPEERMKQDEIDRIYRLCSLIAVEQDRQKFLDLVEELNRILSAQDRHLQNRPPGGEKKD